MKGEVAKQHAHGMAEVRLQSLNRELQEANIGLMVC